MSVLHTTVQEPDGTIREAYGRDNVGREVAETFLKLRKEPITAERVNCVSSIITARKFCSDPDNPWTSYVCNDEERNK